MTPSLLQSGIISASISRVTIEYSDCRAAIRWISFARVSVAALTSERPSAHFPGLHKARHRADQILDGHGGIASVHVVKVDDIDPSRFSEASQA